jgi:hypothetical protein
VHTLSARELSAICGGINWGTLGRRRRQMDEWAAECGREAPAGFKACMIGKGALELRLDIPDSPPKV